MYKKFLISLFSLIIFSTFNLSTFQITLAAPNLAQETQTRIILDDSLRPEYSPGVAIGDSLKKAGAESTFGSYVLQLFAGSLVVVAAPVAVIIIAISGLLYATARGNQGQMEKAKKALTYAITGLIIIILAWVIVRGVISAVLSVNSAPIEATTTSEPKPESKTPPTKEGPPAEKPKAPG